MSTPETIEQLLATSPAIAGIGLVAWRLLVWASKRFERVEERLDECEKAREIERDECKEDLEKVRDEVRSLLSKRDEDVTARIDLALQRHATPLPPRPLRLPPVKRSRRDDMEPEGDE